MNLLVALFDPNHVHHDLAHDWFEDHREQGWATCPVTENGFVRVVSNPKYPGGPEPVDALVSRLKTFCDSASHHFWPDAVSLTDPSLFNPGFVRGHRQLTDLYLLGLAKTKGGRLVSFDQAIPWKAIVGADRTLVEVVAPAAARGS